MITVTIEYDPDLENPAKYDDNWRVISFSRKHINYADPSTLLPPSISLRRKLQVGLAFVLSYYEHGQGEWSLRGEGTQCRFDTAQVAGLIIWDNPPSHIGAKTKEARADDARRFLTPYNDWCNGRGYWWKVERYGVQIDSCGGYYDSDNEYMLSEIRAAIPKPEASLFGDVADDIEVVGDAAYVGEALATAKV